MTPSRRVPVRRVSAVSPEEAVERARIQELFHGVIRSRCREGRFDAPRRLPRLLKVPIAESDADAIWFPVPGMYGGFNYRLERRGNALQLVAESWCRVADGSGMRHVITATQALLVEQGFV